MAKQRIMTVVEEWATNVVEEEEVVEVLFKRILEQKRLAMLPIQPARRLETGLRGF